MVINKEYFVQIRIKGCKASSWHSHVGRRFVKYPMVCKTLSQAKRSFNYYNNRNVVNVLEGGYDSSRGTFEARIVEQKTINTVVKR